MELLLVIYPSCYCNYERENLKFLFSKNRLSMKFYLYLFTLCIIRASLFTRGHITTLTALSSSVEGRLLDGIQNWQHCIITFQDSTLAGLVWRSLSLGFGGVMFFRVSYFMFQFWFWFQIWIWLSGRFYQKRRFRKVFRVSKSIALHS